MAKSSRSRVIKENNRRLKRDVFGPVEAERAARLSAKLLAIATAPKPQKDVEMAEEPAADAPKDAAAEKEDTAMEVDGVKPAIKKSSNKRKDKRRNKKSSIVFQMRGPKRNKK
ncbi:hypothetical protein VTK26DRAFT_2498 [Humicola hyalothermophila]